MAPYPRISICSKTSRPLQRRARGTLDGIPMSMTMSVKCSTIFARAEDFDERRIRL